MQQPKSDQLWYSNTQLANVTLRQTLTPFRHAHQPLHMVHVSFVEVTV